MELRSEQKNLQTISRLQYLDLTVLQLGEEQLQSFLADAADTNPVIDREMSLPSSSSPPRNGRYHLASPALEDAEKWEKEETKTSELFLSEQLLTLSLTKPLESAIRALICLIDDKGYLPESDEELSRLLRLPLTLIHKAVTTLRSLDPAGVGARNLADCLLLQLERLNAPPLPRLLAERYLIPLSRGHFHAVANETGQSEEDVRAAYALLKTLDPHPLSFCNRGGEQLSVIPSVHVFFKNGVYRSEITEPETFFTLNTYYEQLYVTCEDSETRNYLREQFRRAGNLQRALSKRRDTLCRCAEYIVSRQQLFFEKGPAYILPDTRILLAAFLDVHVSTVSRAIDNKYLLCDRGLFPLSYFFRSRTLPLSDGVTNLYIRNRLRTLIQEESSQNPFSDDALVRLLAAENITVSRRAIAKYRAAEHIPCSYQRRTSTPSKKKGNSVCHP